MSKDYEMNKSEIALKLFDEGYNCAQSVLCAFSEETGLDRDLCLKVSSAFGAGVCRQAGVCGAVSGGLMALGLIHCNSSEPMSKGSVYSKGGEFMARFNEANGSLTCKELLGCDISSPDGMQMARDQGLFRTKCPSLVESAVILLETSKS
jgi:C_GCAxxG_C_C family probable redox protein